jgi:hypothetical protein
MEHWLGVVWFGLPLQLDFRPEVCPREIIIPVQPNQSTEHFLLKLSKHTLKPLGFCSFFFLKQRKRMRTAACRGAPS